MIPVRSFDGKRVAVFGLGGSGLSTAEALVAGGADVIAFDDGEPGRAKALAKGIVVADLRTIDWSGIAALVLSPGVPLTHPVPHWSVVLAQKAGVEIIGDIELFARERRFRGKETIFIAVTGTNGKSTTTALIAHLLSQTDGSVQVGGNIGKAILSLDDLENHGTYVIECSSFQIDLARTLDPTVGVLLNLSPDHLDRHGDMQSYAAIKERLVANATTSVIGVDDPMCEAIADRLLGKRQVCVKISAKRKLEPHDFFYADGKIWHTNRIVADLVDIPSLRGQHNGQNACAAISVAMDFGASDDEITRGLQTFPGLPHRMEEVGRLGKVILINDSKATNADSSAQALASFEGIHWIIGGKAKEGGIRSLAPFFPKVAKAYLIGAASDDFATTLDAAGVPYERSGTLDLALKSAARDAASSDAPEPVVLLSPACASYDQFKSFEDRGDQFRQMALALPGVSRRGPIADTSEVA